jgi:hypothetical protein
MMTNESNIRQIYEYELARIPKNRDKLYELLIKDDL